MNYKLVKIEELSGSKASIYSIFLYDEQKTIFDQFLEENINSFKSELNDILKRLKAIGTKTGARSQFFKFNEGKAGDGVCALFDIPGKNLRLYCVRYGTTIVILGGGGHKPKWMKAFQDDIKLTQENYLLRQVSKDIKSRMEENEIIFSDDYMGFEGDLEFNDEEDE